MIQRGRNRQMDTTKRTPYNIIAEILRAWRLGKNLKFVLNQFGYVSEIRNKLGRLVWMGDIIKAICECGFESEDIFAGHGGGFPFFQKICMVPAICLDCRKLLVKDYLKKHAKCPDCGKHACMKVLVLGQIPSG